jgi:hypothetical protein
MECRSMNYSETKKLLMAKSEIRTPFICLFDIRVSSTLTLYLKEAPFIDILREGVAKAPLKP